jgi:hypothetical protein
MAFLSVPLCLPLTSRWTASAKYTVYNLVSQSNPPVELGKPDTCVVDRSHKLLPSAKPFGLLQPLQQLSVQQAALEGHIRI